MQTYAITNWDSLYESNQTRRYKELRWVPIPNKHDGKGYRLIMAHPRGLEIFAAWILILQVASRCPKRGVLADEDGPLDSLDLAARSGGRQEVFELALEFLVAPKIGWLNASNTLSPIPHTPNVTSARESRANVPDSRIESNRIESNRTEAATTETPCRESTPSSNQQRAREDCVLGPARAPDLAEEFIGIFLAAGVKLSEADVMFAFRGNGQCRGFIDYPHSEQLEIVEYARKKAELTSARFMGYPVSMLAKREWERIGPGRLLPEPRRMSRADEAQARAAAEFLAERGEQ